MACLLKERTGSCSHSQCPYSTETTHGFECIDIFMEKVDDKYVSFCEVGDGCLEKCQYSFNKGDGSDVEKAADTWNKRMKDELKEFENEYRNFFITGQH